MKKTLSLAYAVLCALVAAPAVISLIQHWAAIPLAGAFQSLVDAYRDTFGPVSGWIEGGLGSLLGMWGIRPGFPGWLQDLHVLSLVAAVIYLGSRILDRREADTPQVQHASAEDRPEDRLEQEQLAKEQARENRMRIQLHPLAEGLLAPVLILAAGLVGLGVVWLPGILVAGIGHRASWRDEFKAHFAWATAGMVIAFYAGAWAVGLNAPHAPG